MEEIRGLTDEQVFLSRKKQGSNEIVTYTPPPLSKHIMEALSDPSLLILIGALLVSLALSFWGYSSPIESAGILAAVCIAVSVSCCYERANEKKFAELLLLANARNSRVIRNGRVVEVSSTEIVKDDVVVLYPGDIVPADGKLIKGSITVDTSSLTGESRPVEVKEGEVCCRETSVLDGTAYMLVTAVGKETLYGRTVKEMQETETTRGPLYIQLQRLGQDIAVFGYWSATAISLLFVGKQYLQHGQLSTTVLLEALMLGATIVVVAVPEGLPVMIAVVLARNLKKLLKEGVLVRKMSGIETAGSMNVLMIDKTGTLTEGKFKVTGICDLRGERRFYSPDSIPEELKEEIRLSIPAVQTNPIDKLLCSTAGNPPEQETEVIPFTPDRKVSSTTVGGVTRIKGAPEIVAEKFLPQEEAKRVLNLNRKLTLDGLRTILLVKDNRPLCLIAMEDPMREGAKETVKTVKNAGVHIIMATGDVKETAVTISQKAGILEDEKGVFSPREAEEHILQGRDYREIRVIYRCTPEDKLKVLKLLQKKGLTVGMTGDGANDAPALKTADVGIALGSGTEVAREASEIVILDNSISSVKQLVLYGRTVRKNIRKFLRFQLTVNFSAILIELAGQFVGFNKPLTLVQLLWVNLIMDTLGAVAFSGEPPQNSYMREKPVDRKERIVNLRDLKSWSGSALLIGTAALSCGTLLKKWHTLPYAQTAMFTFFVFLTNWLKFNCRCEGTDGLLPFSGIRENPLFLAVVTTIFAVQILLVYLAGELAGTVPLEPALTLKLLVLSFPLSFFKVAGFHLRPYGRSLPARKG